MEGLGVAVPQYSAPSLRKITGTLPISSFPHKSLDPFHGDLEFLNRYTRIDDPEEPPLRVPEPDARSEEDASGSKELLPKFQLCILRVVVHELRQVDPDEEASSARHIGDAEALQVTDRDSVRFGEALTVANEVQGHELGISQQTLEHPLSVVLPAL